MSKLRNVPFRSSTAEFRAGSDTPSAYLERCLATIERLEPGIGAFVTLNVPAAQEAAAQATRRCWREGRPRSPIDGMPIGIAADALPIGLQVIGFRDRDADLIAIARSATLPQPDIVTSVPAAAAVGCGLDPYRT
jgi:Asp-tRNA(Asn)/Glu-tRNA(Gln) amidotransferase A subunit family amidase